MFNVQPWLIGSLATEPGFDSLQHPYDSVVGGIRKGIWPKLLLCTR